MSNSDTISNTIGKNLRAFHSDAGFVRASKKLDSKQLEQATRELKQHCSVYFGFYFARERMRAMKALHGELAAGAEARLAQHGDLAAAAYGDALSSLQRVRGLLASSGMLPVVNKHMRPLCVNLDHNPRTPALIEEFRGMGVPDSAIACMRGHFAKANYDLLHYAGNDGTLESAVRAVEKQITPMRESIRNLRTHGLSLIEGSGALVAPIVNALVAAVTAVVVAATAIAVAVAETAVAVGVAVAGTAAAVGTAIGDAAAAAGTAIGDAAAAAGTAIGDTAQAIAEGAADTAQAIAERVSDTAEAVAKAFKDNAENPPTGGGEAPPIVVEPRGPASGTIITIPLGEPGQPPPGSVAMPD